MNYSLDENQSSELLRALCYDVKTLRASNGKSYVYFWTRKLSILMVVKYILKLNGVKSNLHFTRYRANLGGRTLIVRAPFVNNNFLQHVKSNRSQKYVSNANVPCAFSLLPRGVKNRVVAKLHENVK